VTDLLLGEFSLDEVIISPGLDNLFFIPGGAVPPNPSDLIESQALQWFIEEAKNEYDMILFDTAPILSTADSAVLGAKVDGVLLVYRIGTVPKGLLKRSITQLMQVKANVIGVILNGMRPEVSPDFEEYKHYSYYYSNGEDGKKRRKTKNLFVAETRGLTPSDLDESGAEKEEQQGWSQPKNKLGLLLAALASVLLAGGILWQTHKTDLPIPNTTGNLVQKEEMIIPAKEQGAIDLDLEKPSVSAVQEYQPANALETGRSTPEATRIEPLKAETNLPSVPEGTNAVLAGPTEEELHPPASIPATSHSAVTYPFSLWLCTMPQVREAERRISKYIKKGLPAYYSEVALRGGIRYRLYTGYFETKEQAESFKQEKGLKDAEVKETPFSNLIGTFTTAEELEDRIESLKRVGLSPYVIKDADGKQRLLVGAFHSEERAKRQYEELKSKGLENQIVLR
jgi:Mrp family chromosome partitioning ATPase